MITFIFTIIKYLDYDQIMNQKFVKEGVLKPPTMNPPPSATPLRLCIPQIPSTTYSYFSTCNSDSCWQRWQG